MDFQFVRYQEHHGSYEFESSAYDKGVETGDSLLVPGSIAVKNVMKTDDVCVSYKVQDYSIVVPGVPDDGSIKTPGVPENWLDKEGVNPEIAKEERADTNEAVSDEREKIIKKKETGAGEDGDKADGGSGVASLIAPVFTLVGALLLI
jgi:hypothetical protein